MIYILSFLAIVGYYIMFKWAQHLDKHYKWFSELKPGDMILVEIFSNDCECFVEAMVINEANGSKYIEAEISTDKKKECERCHKANNSCLYNVNSFHRSSVSKIL